MRSKNGYSAIGLDLGETSIKMVQLRAGKMDRWHLHAIARQSCARIDSADDDGEETEAQISMIKRMLAEHGFVGRNVATVLRRADVLIRPVNLPNTLDPRDAEKVWEALQSEARRYLPYPPEEAVLDFLAVGKVHDEEEAKLEVLLISAPEDKVNEHLSLLRAAGLHCTCIDVVPCAVIRTASQNGGQGSEDATVVVEIGDRATIIGIFRAGQLFFSRNVNTGGATLTDAIAKKLGLAVEKAETFKRRYGIDHRSTLAAEFKDDTRICPDDMPAILCGLCQEELKRLSHEIKRSVDYFATQFREVTVDHVLLFGGGANLSGLTEFLADETGLSVEVGDPFVSVSTDDGALDERVDKDRASFSVALGLALREG
jgi:type IV pilus assembly protein PilM